MSRFAWLGVCSLFVGCVTELGEPGDDFDTLSAVEQEAAVVTKIAVEADSWVNESSKSWTGGGSATKLELDRTPHQHAYLRFRISGLQGPVTQAKLVLVAAGNASSRGAKLYRTSNTWSESTLSWSNRPALGTTALASVASVGGTSTISFDVTAAITGDGVFSFALVPDSTDGFNVHARESAYADRRPVLLVTSEPPPTSQPPPPPSSSDGPIGYAAVNALGLPTTTGGAGGEVVTATTASQFNTLAGGTTPRIVQVSGTITGTLRVGSNKTIVGLAGSSLRGSVQIDDATNVIMRDLTIVGYNCSDNPDCGSGLDAIVVRRGHHMWFDHLDVSDGSDGNFDTRDADYITISWCKFHYSAQRDPDASGDPHRFSNGHSSDTGDKFRVTLHHNWWAANVFSRMPRVSYGNVHVFNNLMASPGNESCIGLAGDAQVRVENNHFLGVDDPVKIMSTVNSASVAVSTGNLYENATGTKGDYGTQPIFTPGYAYTLESASTIRMAIEAGAGPRN